jgi:hypothetical protein
MKPVRDRVRERQRRGRKEDFGALNYLIREGTRTTNRIKAENSCIFVKNRNKY